MQVSWKMTPRRRVRVISRSTCKGFLGKRLRVSSTLNPVQKHFSVYRTTKPFGVQSCQACHAQLANCALLEMAHWVFDSTHWFRQMPSLFFVVLDELCMYPVMSKRVPGHALHEKGLQRQKGVGPLVGSQEERALLVPVINR